VAGIIHQQYIRLCAFEKLEITHTCCKGLTSNKYDCWFQGFEPRVSEEDIYEIQQEELELIDRLEAFMRRYAEAFTYHEGTVMEFVSEWLDLIYNNDGAFLWSLDVEGSFETSTNGSNSGETERKEARIEKLRNVQDVAKENSETLTHEPNDKWSANLQYIEDEDEDDEDDYDDGYFSPPMSQWR
jgi:hypothetical protein